MGFVRLFIELTLVIFSSWTIAYHISLLLNLSAQSSIILYLGIFTFGSIFFYQKWLKTCKQSIINFKRLKNLRNVLLLLFFLSLGTGTLALLINKPNADDFSFFHRVLVQVQYLDRPFILTDTAHNINGLPSISIAHILAAYEPFVALSTHIMGIDPLWGYQNVMAFIAAFLLPCVYFLLYKQLRLNRVLALVSTTTVILFLMIDGNVIRSFGNFSLVRCWQGKSILIMLLIPVILLFCLRFLNSPNYRNLALVTSGGICAVGLSSSGIFLSSILIFASSVTYGVIYGNHRKRLQRTILLNIASIYPIFIAILIFSGILEMPSNQDAWNLSWWPDVWWQNIGLVIGDIATLKRDLLILLFIPLISLKRSIRFFPLTLVLILCSIFANPVLGPIWVKSLKPAAYWRLTYLFPLPLCAGLITVPIVEQILKRSTKLLWLKTCFCTIIFILIFQAYQTSILPVSADKIDLHYKHPGEYKLVKKDLNFVQSVQDELSYSNLLASENMVVVIGLVDPTVRFESTRIAQTLHLFTNTNQKQEGIRRINAQKLATDCRRSPIRDKAILQSINKNHVNAIILRSCNPKQLAAVLELFNSNGMEWNVVRSDDTYSLLIRDKN